MSGTQSAMGKAKRHHVASQAKIDQVLRYSSILSWARACCAHADASVRTIARSPPLWMYLKRYLHTFVEKQTLTLMCASNLLVRYGLYGTTRELSYDLLVSSSPAKPPAAAPRRRYVGCELLVIHRARREVFPESLVTHVRIVIR